MISKNALLAGLILGVTVCHIASAHPEGDHKPAAAPTPSLKDGAH